MISLFISTFVLFPGDGWDTPQAKSAADHAIKHAERAKRDKPDAAAWVAVIGHKAAEEKAAGEENGREDEGQRNRWLDRESINSTKGQAGDEIDKGEHRPVKVTEGKHEPAYFVPDIEVPADLKSVHHLKSNPERDIDRQGPPAKTEMSRGVIHVRGRVRGGFGEEYPQIGPIAQWLSLGFWGAIEVVGGAPSSWGARPSILLGWAFCL